MRKFFRKRKQNELVAASELKPESLRASPRKGIKEASEKARLASNADGRREADEVSS